LDYKLNINETQIILHNTNLQNYSQNTPQQFFALIFRKILKNKVDVFLSYFSRFFTMRAEVFLSCMAFNVYEVVLVAFVNVEAMQRENLCSHGNFF